MKTMTRLLLALAFFIPVCAHAQSTPEPVRVRFLLLDESSGDYSVKLGAEFKNLGSKPYVISSPLEFRPGDHLELYKELPDPKSGKPVRTRVINLIAPSPKVSLMVIAPSATVGTDGAPAYNSRFYDVSPEKTPNRSIRILNLSPSPMAARFGSDQVEISPGTERVVTPTFDKRSRIRVFVASQGQGEWQMIFNSFLSLGETAHMTGIVVYSPSGLRHTYTEDELATLGPPKPGFFWLYFTDSTEPN